MHRYINGVAIEWDVAKNDINIKKHGLSFETATLVFADADRVEFYDFRHSIDEARYVTIGLVNNLITVIYTERKQALRIISARVATLAERKIYYGQNHKNHH